MPGRRVAAVLVALAALAGCNDRGGADVAAPTAPGGQSATAETVRNVPRVPKLDPGILPRVPELHSGLFEPVEPPPPSEPKVCEAWTLAGPLFETNVPTLSPAATPVVKELAESLLTKEGPFQVGGHADERSTSFPGGNDGLSLARAENLRLALIAAGVPADRFVPSVGHGARQPVDPRPNPEAYRVNRRVEVKRFCG